MTQMAEEFLEALTELIDSRIADAFRNHYATHECERKKEFRKKTALEVIEEQMQELNEKKQPLDRFEPQWVNEPPEEVESEAEASVREQGEIKKPFHNELAAFAAEQFAKNFRGNPSTIVGQSLSPPQRPSEPSSADPCPTPFDHTKDAENGC